MANASPPTTVAGMPATSRLAWLRSGLFWRTFILLALLITVSMAAWVSGVRMVEREPRARQIGAQVVSMVTITRAALAHSAPELRRELLFELASNEGIRVYPLEKNDQVVPTKSGGMLDLIKDHVRDRLGTGTHFASAVNGVPGFWISFDIEGDDYWLMLDRRRVDRASGTQWAGWAMVTLLLSLLGAVFISRLINQPLARLSAAARAVATGATPPALPETGPAEVRDANRSFNHMVEDLNRVESDRAVILAGISHDLRTPLARMQLEVEMAQLSPEARAGMQSDLGQMDAIIGQFLDYAKASDPTAFAEIDLSALIADAAREADRMPNLQIATQVADGITIYGHAVDLRRIVANLVENARRYAKHPDSGKVNLAIDLRAEGSDALLEIADDGPGVPESEIARLLRPFTRLDTARGQANGAGLGLAIVDRLVKRHGGQLKLGNRAGGGLAVQIRLPLAR